MSIWDSIPGATEVNISQLSPQERQQLLAEYIDEENAATLVRQLDDSASDYVANIERIDFYLGLINTAVSGAIKIAKIVV